jgi:hypothetical protein
MAREMAREMLSDIFEQLVDIECAISRSTVGMIGIVAQALVFLYQPDQR